MASKKDEQAIHFEVISRMPEDVVESMVAGQGQTSIDSAAMYRKLKLDVEAEIKAGKWKPPKEVDPVKDDSKTEEDPLNDDSLLNATAQYVAQFEAAAREKAYDCVQPYSKAAAKMLALCKDGQALLDSGGEEGAMMLVAKQLGVDAAKNDKDLCENQFEAAVAIYKNAADDFRGDNDEISANAFECRAALYKTVDLLLKEPVTAPVMSKPENNAVKALLLDRKHWARHALQKSFDVKGVSLMGYLKKRGPMFNFKWDERFCVLRRNKFETYSEGTCYELKESIDLGEYSRAIALTDPTVPAETTKYRNMPNGFVLDPVPHAGKDRQFYYFDTGNSDKLQSWLAAFEQETCRTKEEAASTWLGMQSASSLMSSAFGRLDQMNAGKNLLNTGGPKLGKVLLAKAASKRAAALDALILQELRCGVDLFQESALLLPAAARLEQVVEGIEWNMESIVKKKADQKEKDQKKAEEAKKALLAKKGDNVVKKPAKKAGAGKAEPKKKSAGSSKSDKTEAEASVAASSKSEIEHVAIDYASHRANLLKALALLGDACEEPSMNAVEEDATAILQKAMALTGANL